MKTICRNLHCWVLPQEVSIENSGQAFDKDGAMTDPALDVRGRWRDELQQRIVADLDRARFDFYIRFTWSFRIKE